MVVLINKLPNFHHKSKKSKMDQSESIALQNFHINISENLDKLYSGRKNGSNNEISLCWYIPCFKFLQSINRAFTKLVKDLNYPVSKWSGKLAEDYFSYTLNLLDALNMISSLISQVGISRLNLTHAISLITTSPSSSIQHLVPIIPKKVTVFESKEMSKDGRFNCGQERVIHEAMMEMRGVDMLVLRVLLCGLNGEKNEEFGGLFTEDTRGSSPGFKQLYEPPQTWGVTEIKEVNEMVKRIEACLFSGENKKGCENAQELKRKLSEVERLTEMVGKEVNGLFSEVLARRNELINCFRLPQCS